MMNEQIKQIAERLAGLRDALEITPEEMAKVCNMRRSERSATCADEAGGNARLVSAPVSYTHLDVYKRQAQQFSRLAG